MDASFRSGTPVPLRYARPVVREGQPRATVVRRVVLVMLIVTGALWLGSRALAYAVLELATF